jgi:hypothetical protein
MLKLLLDENISHVVATQILLHRPDIRIESIHSWRNGALLQADDTSIVAAAVEDGMTLVTYDQSTIQPLLKRWVAPGRDHAGVVYVSSRSIRQGDIGRMTESLIHLWDRLAAEDLTNQTLFLHRPR